MTLLSFDTSLAGGVAVVTLTGELDVAGSVALEPELLRLTSEDSAPVLVLDLTGLEFMDSTGLRMVVMADARCREAGRRLVLVPGPAAVQRVFDVTRMNERLEFVERVEDVSA